MIWPPRARRARLPAATDAVPRDFNRPFATQIELRAGDLDSPLASDHRARSVWQFVQSLDLAVLHAGIRAVEGRPDRPPSDPAIVVACCGCMPRWMAWARHASWRGCATAMTPTAGCAGAESTTTRSATSEFSRPLGWTSRSRAAWPHCWRRAR
jgi:hypothetical protein